MPPTATPAAIPGPGPQTPHDLLCRTILENDSRNRIYGYIAANNGAHFRKILRECGLGIGATLYHLHILCSNTILRPKKDGNRDTFWVNWPLRIPSSSIRLTSGSQTVLAIIRAQGWMYQKDLKTACSLARNTISYHVHELEKKGCIRIEYQTHHLRKLIFLSDDGAPRARVRYVRPDPVIPRRYTSRTRENN